MPENADRAPAAGPVVSIVVPILDEAGTLPRLAAHLTPLRGAGAEVIVVDGGSRDGSPGLARAAADQLVSAPRGRARQMNAGARAATADILLFLHADTRLPGNALDRVRGAVAGGAHWGFFGLAVSGRHPLLPVIGLLATARSRMTGIATGDQGLFVTRDLFRSVGGFPDIPLMEDLALCDRLRRHVRPARLAGRATTSGRRWQRRGVARTIVLMWRLRLLYRLGVAPQRLVGRYADIR